MGLARRVGVRMQRHKGLKPDRAGTVWLMVEAGNTRWSFGPNRGETAVGNLPSISAQIR
jgi:hypothetical protein